MKKLFVIALLTFAFVSCKKENVSAESTSTIFIRVESVDTDGQATYSPVSVVRN